MVRRSFSATGGLGSGTTWEGSQVIFATATGVHRWDQRGCGRSGPAAVHGIERALQDVQDLHRGFGVNGKWVVVGHSWGAYLALLTALAHPDTTSGLVYISGNGTPEHWRKHGHEVAEARVAERMSRADQTRLAELESRSRTWDEEVEFRRLKWRTDFVDQSTPPPELEEMATSPLEINFSVNRALSRAELYPTHELLMALEACELPALFVHGGEDPRREGGARELSERMPNARFERVDHAGHLPWIEESEVTVRIIRDFIESAIP